MSDQLLNHESIHIKQQMELLVIGFYALYVWYWAKSLLKGKTPSEAYYGLPFEREAYDNDFNLEYLAERKPWAWRKYIE